MKLTIRQAAKILCLGDKFDVIQLKEAYRRELKIWHPDLNPHRIEKATERCQKLNAAYDLLESIAQEQQEWENEWAEWAQARYTSWEKQFKKLWKTAHKDACKGGAYSGLNYRTCIENFTRSAISPPAEWFAHVLYKDTEATREKYREHLLQVAPNQKLREEWAKKYFALEFSEGGWIFYLPGSDN